MVVLGLVFSIGTWVGWRSATAAKTSPGAQKATSYSCPMHPAYHSDRPGDCASCGMRLEPVCAGIADLPRGDASPATPRVPGLVEPRAVETGWRLGGQVEIVKGLMPGDQIVVAGTFPIDSESRMKIASAGVSSLASERDPICGIEVDPARARAAELTSVRQGRTYYFCHEGCKRGFEANPADHAAVSQSF